MPGDAPEGARAIGLLVRLLALLLRARLLRVIALRPPTRGRRVPPPLPRGLPIGRPQALLRPRAPLLTGPSLFLSHFASRVYPHWAHRGLWIRVCGSIF